MWSQNWKLLLWFLITHQVDNGIKFFFNCNSFLQIWMILDKPPFAFIHRILGLPRYIQRCLWSPTFFFLPYGLKLLEFWKLNLNSTHESFFCWNIFNSFTSKASSFKIFPDIWLSLHKGIVKPLPISENKAH